MMSNTIPVHEKFFAFQGEGDHMGRSAYFIRTFGCPLKCPWCDSAGTWHPDYIPETIDRESIILLAEEATSFGAEFVVLTGGEPTVHKKTLPILCEEIKKRGVPVHLETSGAFEMDKENFDWITLSPKLSKLPTEYMLKTAHELKIIVDDENAIEFWVDKVSELLADSGPTHYHSIWLHPEWSRKDDPLILNAISEFVKHPKLGNIINGRVRAGYQLHKLYKVDSLDSGAKGQSPLGGNPGLGF